MPLKILKAFKNFEIFYGEEKVMGKVILFHASFLSLLNRVANGFASKKVLQRKSVFYSKAKFSLGSYIMINAFKKFIACVLYF